MTKTAIAKVCNKVVLYTLEVRVKEKLYSYSFADNGMGIN